MDLAFRNKVTVTSLTSHTVFYGWTGLCGHLDTTLPLLYNKLWIFLDHTNLHNRGFKSHSATFYCILLYVNKCISARFSACMSACEVFVSLHTAPKKQRKQQSAVVDSNRPYKQHHKSSFQTSNSIQLRFGLALLHLTQVRQDTAVQPLTILALEVTAPLRPAVWKQFLCLLCSFILSLTHLLLFSSVTKTKQLRHIHFIKSSFPFAATTLLFKASFLSLCVVSIFTFTTV